MSEKAIHWQPSLPGLGTSSNKVLDQVDFRHHENDKEHQVNAYIGGDRVGHMQWFKDAGGRPDEPAGEIGLLQVEPQYTRNGVATAMYEAARQHQFAPAPAHSPSRTDEGDAWARKVGGDLPPRRG